MCDQKTIWQIEGAKLIKYFGEEPVVAIPEGVEEIGASAFRGIKKLTQVSIPASVHIVGYGAFANCTSLVVVKMESIQYIRPYAFAGCTALERVDFQDSPLKGIGYCVFKGCSSLRRFVAPPSVKRISEGAFCKCTALEYACLPASVEEIRKYAFSKCYHLKEVELQSNHTYIDPVAFHKCNTGLKFVWDTKASFPIEAREGFDIDDQGVLKAYFGSAAEATIPAAAIKTGWHAFYGNTALEVLYAPFLKTVAKYSLSSCRKLKHAVFNCVTEVETSAFWACTNLKTVVFSETLERLGADAFGQCHKLERLSFANPSIVFDGRIAPMAYGLKEVELPVGLKAVPKSAFYYCKSLQKCVIPQTVEVIDDGAFEGCQSLREMQIPEKVKELDWEVFRGCSSLIEVVLLGSDTKMTGRTDEFCTATYRYYNQPRVKTAVIFMGIQGSGKTHYYNWHFAGKYVHINLDTLHTRNKENQAIQECVDKGLDFVIDNTNPTKMDRQRYIPFLKDAGYRIVGYFFESKVKDCIRRNERRSGKAQVPNGAIAATSNKLQIPSWDEGFDELYFVERSGEIVMLKRDWRD